MNKLKFIIVFSIFLTSCNTNKLFTNQSKLVYENKNNSSEKLTLKKDNTFSYRYFMGLVDIECQGEWSQENNLFTLNMDENLKTGLLASEEKIKNKPKGEIEVITVLSDKTPLLGYVYVNDDTTTIVEANDNGIAILNYMTELKKITVSYVVGGEYNYYVKNVASNNFYFEIEPRELSSCNIENEKWVIKSKQKLINPKKEIFVLQNK